MNNNSISFKNERISETDSAANSNEVEKTGSGYNDNLSSSSTASNKSVPDKKDLIRMIGYPVVVGSVFGIGGSLLASKLNKNKKLFSVAGVLVGVGLGYALFLNYERKNSRK